MKSVLGFLVVMLAHAQALNIQSGPAPPVCSLDESSFSNCNEIQQYNFQLDLSIDLDKQRIEGYNTINLTSIQDGVKQVVLDYQGIVINQVGELRPDGSFIDLSSSLATYTDTNLGSALVIQLNRTLMKNENITIRILYYTTTDCKYTFIIQNQNQRIKESLVNLNDIQLMAIYKQTDAKAMSWMNEEQTATKLLKYMFTQCQPIYCRSVAPIQDTPSIKTTYQANVTVKDPYVVKMSGFEVEKTSNKGQNTSTYHFYQTIPIPSYLLAIAVGNLVEQKIGDQYSRSSVISEPGANYLDFYANELSGLDDMLNRTEKWLTPYIWGKYSILVLPPSFPFGGMENPMLTFASPTVLVGDKSQIYVVNHEIAHSWTGNAVTCRDWSDLWLNEGFTVFEERKISEEHHGTDFAKREAQLGNVTLWIDLEIYGMNSTFTALYPELNGINPDDLFSDVPYQKGSQFLIFLESTLLSKDDFQNLLREYILNYQLQSVTYENFKSFFESWITDEYDAETVASINSQIDWDAWIQKGGANPEIAKSRLNFTTDGAVQFEALADAYISLGGDSSPPNYKDYIDAVDPQLKVIFINRLQAKSQLVNTKILANSCLLFLTSNFHTVLLNTTTQSLTNIYQLWKNIFCLQEFLSMKWKQFLSSKFIFRVGIILNYNIIANDYKIDSDLNVTLSPNPEIGMRWFPLALTRKYDSVIDVAHHYVSYQGRLRYLQPVYRALVACGKRGTAYQWFIENQNFYHPIAVDAIRIIVLSKEPTTHLLEKVRFDLSLGIVKL